MHKGSYSLGRMPVIHNLFKILNPVSTEINMKFSVERANKNIVLATTNHGGHLAFFEGLTGSSLWFSISQILTKLKQNGLLLAVFHCLYMLYTGGFEPPTSFLALLAAVVICIYRK